VLYPGNLQGRHVREPGARGCTWLEVQDGQLTDLEHRDLDVVRWAHCQVDASELATVEDLHEVLAGRFAAVRQASADRPTLVRVIVTGAGPLHGSLARHPDRARHQIEVLAAESGDLWTEQVRFRTTPPAALPQDDLLDLRAAIVRELEQLAADPEALAPYLESLGSVSRKVGRLLAERPDSAERVRALLPQVEALIRARLGVPA
jgi:hypothetical protein